MGELHKPQTLHDIQVVNGHAEHGINGFHLVLCCWLPLLLILCLSDAVRAEHVADIYEAEAAVQGQGIEARTRAIRTAFAKVLVKASGDRDLPARSSMAKEMNKANQYVQQYRYRSLDAGPSHRVSGDAAPDRLLWVRFDEAAINRVLRKGGVPVWGSTRPSTLVWLGVERRGQRSLYQPESDPDLRHRLEGVARSRGLPILFPLMDLEDRRNLQVSDVWGAFEEAIRGASDRYLPDVILVGRLHKEGRKNWIGDWTLYQPDTQKSWQNHAKTRQMVATDGLHRLVDQLANRFAPKDVVQGGTNLRIRVAGLDYLADYIRVNDYLASMDMIEKFDLLSATPNEASFLVRIQGGREALEKGIRLGRVLEPIVVENGPVGAGATTPETLEAESLNYRLRQ